MEKYQRLITLSKRTSYILMTLCYLTVFSSMGILGREVLRLNSPLCMTGFWHYLIIPLFAGGMLCMFLAMLNEIENQKEKEHDKI